MKKIFRMAAFMLALGSMTAGFTSCGEDEEGETIVDQLNADEVIETAGLTIKANANGTIQFVGDVESNAKIKTFQLVAADGTVKYDFVKDNDQVKDKLKDIAEDGKVTKEKIFSVKGINSPELPVDLYTLVIKTKKANTEVALGEEKEYTIGAAKSATGSYLNIAEAKQMTFEEAKTAASEVIALSDEDGKGANVIGLKKASAANNKDIAAKAAKVALFQGGASVEDIKEGGVIITESGCICQVKSFVNTATGDATIKTVTIQKTAKTNITVDVKGYTFSK